MPFLPRAHRAAVTLAAALVLTGGHVLAAAPIVAGDVIVKFRDRTEPGAQLGAVLAGQRTVASVAPLATRLSMELALPLVLVQVTSGREALLALDREALTQVLLARARREQGVQGGAAATDAALAPGVLPGSDLVLQVQLRPGAAPSLPGHLAKRLAAGGLVPPRVQREGDGKSLQLHYDMDALTLALITKLQRRPDVEYAQANRLLRPAPAAPVPAASTTASGPKR